MSFKRGRTLRLLSTGLYRGRPGRGYRGVRFRLSMESFTFFRLSVAFFPGFRLSATFRCLLGVFRISAAFQNRFPVSAVFKNSFPFFAGIFKFSGFLWLKKVIFRFPAHFFFSFPQIFFSFFLFSATFLGPFWLSAINIRPLHRQWSRTTQVVVHVLLNIDDDGQLNRGMSILQSANLESSHSETYFLWAL